MYSGLGSISYKYVFVMHLCDLKYIEQVYFTF